MPTNAQEIILKQNERAPFYGVLVPEDNYRMYQRAYETNLNLTEQMLEMKSQCVSDPPGLGTWIAVSTLGFTLGVLVYGLSK